jgi:uncharacterized protein YndB with AHSA1/START domain
MSNQSATNEKIDPVIVRTFNAPRELVFKTFTEAEHLRNWFSPKGFTTSVARFDLRPGGVFHYSQRNADGHEMWGKFVYREISPVEKLVYVNSFSNAEGNTVRAPFNPNWPLEILNTLTFEDQEGMTTLMMRLDPVDPSQEEIQTFESMVPMVKQGFGSTFEQLAEYLANIKSV